MISVALWIDCAHEHAHLVDLTWPGALVILAAFALGLLARKV